MSKKKASRWQRARAYVQRSIIHGPVDYNLLFTIIFLNVYGIIMVYSASYNNTITKNSNYFMMNQLKNVGIGLGAMWLASCVNYHHVVRLGWGWSWLAIAVLVVILLKTPLAHSELGATRWIYLGPISFQAAEPIKAAIILFLAFYVRYVGLKTCWRQFALIGITALLFGFLFAFSNNLSTVIVLFGICGVVILTSVKQSDLRWYFIAFVAIFVILAVGLTWYLITHQGAENFRFVRIRAWLHPEEYAANEGLQAMQARYAIGAGGFWGKGLGQSLIKFKLSYSYNDFILAIICEELGVFGVIIMMSLFGYLLYRIYKIAQNAWDIDGKVIAIGVFTQIALQLLINVMVVTSVIPTTGVTLPFFSAGGTSVVFLLAELGVVLNVDKYAKERRFLEEAERYVDQLEQRGGVGSALWRRRFPSVKTRKG